MKKFISIILSLYFLGMAGCAISTSTAIPHAAPSPTATVIPSQVHTATSTVRPTHTFTPVSNQVVLPEVTMSPQEAENALLELLKTNGNCTGKCIAGIYPDDMTLQEAVDTMAQWGTIRTGKNVLDMAYIAIEQYPLPEGVLVSLGVVSDTDTLESIDHVEIWIFSGSERFLGEDLWLANRDAWQGFRFDNLLKAYGVPSYVGFTFATIVEVGSPLEGRTIEYDIMLYYEQTNLVIVLPTLAYYDGETLFLCPSEDPHNLEIDLNPTDTEANREELFSVTWQALTDTDLDAFYQMFTHETSLEACITTTIEQIMTLQPWFR
ncbi:MAG TPA: hypothetical protein VFF78_05850 [Anaerolineaceae bacterium]|nr:hypothetical protein [Anaerolineaceae bacterium]